MTDFDTSQVDLELGHCQCHQHHRRSSSSNNSSDEDGSCNSQFYSTIDNQSLAYVSDIEKDSVLGMGTMESDCEAVMREREERDCRICHMSLGDDECGVGIELGCCCKDDLAAAHKTCAEAWFKIKGNKTCEICNSVARNVFNSNENEPTQQINDPNVITMNALPSQGSSSNETRGCINGHRFVNFLLACMVFIFILSWLFHFNIHS